MKRFYAQVNVEHSASGFHIHLDGKPILTPGRVKLAVPSETLAIAIAAEWSLQGVNIDPKTMPLTRHANSVLDRIEPRRADVVAEIADFAGSDSLCYRAHFPDDLVKKQSENWDPLLEWAMRTYNISLTTTKGVGPTEQAASTLATLAEAVDKLSVWQLSALHAIVHISGSLVTGLAVVLNEISCETAWQAAQLEEIYQIERWGSDDLASAALNAKRFDFEKAVQWVQLLG